MGQSSIPLALHLLDEGLEMGDEGVAHLGVSPVVFG